ncbi:hypothetical protein Avbf_16003 [Armadillidium vulgare]|nr:hypothetical protein Avbf_16003 [Armadillidium vulgare]
MYGKHSYSHTLKLGIMHSYGGFAHYLYYGTITCNMPRHYEKKEGTRRIMYRQDDIARAMIDVQEGIVSLKDLQDASTSGTNQRDTPQEEIQDVPELPDLDESFDETSSEFNIGDYVLFLRKAERGKHNENEIAFKDPEHSK